MDQQSIPLNNKDVIARAKQMKELQANNLSGQGEVALHSFNQATFTTIENNLIDQKMEESLGGQNLVEEKGFEKENSEIFYKTSDKPESPLRHQRSDNKQSQLQNKGIDTALINYEEKERKGSKQSKRSGNKKKHPVSKRLSTVTGYQDLNLTGKNINKSHANVGLNNDRIDMQQDSKDKSLRQMKPSKDGTELNTRASRQMSKIISESMLDCRDIGIGTMGMNGDDIDQFLKNSHDILQAAILNENGEFYKV